MANIHYIKRSEIDITKWDHCIDNATNGLIYAYSFYLDAMCDNWDALVMGNYEAVMPLPWRRKWGIRYVYQPAFIQRLGIFGTNLTEKQFDLFFITAAKKFSLIHYNITQSASAKNAATKALENFYIDLSNSYTDIRKNYTAECIKNINKATSRGCSFMTDVKTEQVTTYFKNAYGALNSNLTDRDYIKFNALVQSCLLQQKVLLAGVKDENGTVVFCAALFKDAKRLYYVLGAPTALGRQKRAPYFFIDAVLKAYAGQPLLFDFEGSVIPSVAAFYKKFSPAVETYYEVKINRLPPPLKWLK